MAGHPGSPRFHPPEGREGNRSGRDGEADRHAGRWHRGAVATGSGRGLGIERGKAGAEVGSWPGGNDARSLEGGDESKRFQALGGNRAFGIFFASLRESLGGVATTAGSELEHGVADPVQAAGLAGYRWRLRRGDGGADAPHLELVDLAR